MRMRRWRRREFIDNLQMADGRRREEEVSLKS
jgi:hypothetical protein